MATTRFAPAGAAIFVGVGAGYLLLAQYVVFLNDPVYLGAGFWPGAGLTLGALLLLPTQCWPWVLAAIAAAEARTPRTVHLRLQRGRAGR